MLLSKLPKSNAINSFKGRFIRYIYGKSYLEKLAPSNQNSNLSFPSLRTSQRRRFLSKGCTFRWVRGNLLYNINLIVKNKIKYIHIII